MTTHSGFESLIAQLPSRSVLSDAPEFSADTLTSSTSLSQEPYVMTGETLNLWSKTNNSDASGLIPDLNINDGMQTSRGIQDGVNQLSISIKMLDARKSINDLIQERVFQKEQRLRPEPGNDNVIDFSQWKSSKRPYEDSNFTGGRGQDSASLYQFTGVTERDYLRETGESVSQRMRIDPLTGTIEPSERASGLYWDVLDRGENFTRAGERRQQTGAQFRVGDSQLNRPLETGEMPEIVVNYEDTKPTAREKRSEPDFVVTRDGRIKVINNPEENPRKQIVIELERAEGEIGEPPHAQAGAVKALLEYLRNRILEQYSDAVKKQIDLKDDQGLVPPEAKNAPDFAPSSSAGDLPGNTQRQVEQMNRLAGSGRGSMSAPEAREIFPQSEAPRLPSESDQMAALKNVIAGFESRGQKHPYTAVQPRGASGMGIGRYAFTAPAILNWIAWLSDEDLEAIEDLESGKGGNGKGKLPRGTAAKLRAIRSAARNRGATNDPGAKNFIDLMKKMAQGNEQIGEAEVSRQFPMEMQELMAADLIHRFAAKATDAATGKVDIGKVVLAMHLGKVPDQQALEKPEHIALMKAAENAYPLALKSVLKPNDSVTWKESNGKISSNPNDYFFTQFRDAKWNPNGPARSNNCGPASLAMALRAFGKAGDSDPERLIERTRVMMTGRNDNTYTNNNQVSRGARAAGLNSEQISGASSFDRALNEGKM
ncbi:MAG TPA: hypothetical protein V6D17_13975, partial [Candidatus Obscuribacterales bacterium]